MGDGVRNRVEAAASPQWDGKTIEGLEVHLESEIKRLDGDLALERLKAADFDLFSLADNRHALAAKVGEMTAERPILRRLCRSMIEDQALLRAQDVLENALLVAAKAGVTHYGFVSEVDVVGREKTCSVCETEKPIESFCKHRNTPDGRSGQCRECARAYKRANRVRILETERKLREFHRDAKVLARTRRMVEQMNDD